MSNLPPLSINPQFAGTNPPTPGPVAAGAQVAKDRKMVSAEQLVLDLTNSNLRENALLELSKKREIFQDLAPLLWYSFGTVAALVQEIISIYPFLSPPTLSPVASNRVCNALALLQCVASHPETRNLFLKEIIPLCLRTMEIGSELSKTVATFIVQKILLDDVGLQYICATAERFFAVGRVLGTMVASLAEQPSSRLLKHIIRCYLRLSDNPRACEALKNCLPDILTDGTFNNCLRDDPTTRRWLQQLIHNVTTTVARVPMLQAGGLEHMLAS